MVRCKEKNGRFRFFLFQSLHGQAFDSKEMHTPPKLSGEREKNTHALVFYHILPTDPFPSHPLPTPLSFLCLALPLPLPFFCHPVLFAPYRTQIRKGFFLQFLHRPSLARRMRCFGFPDDGDRVSAAEGDAAVAVPDGVDPKMAENRSDELDDAAPTAGAD